LLNFKRFRNVNFNRLSASELNKTGTFRLNILSIP